MFRKLLWWCRSMMMLAAHTTSPQRQVGILLLSLKKHLIISSNIFFFYNSILLWWIWLCEFSHDVMIRIEFIEYFQGKFSTVVHSKCVNALTCLLLHYLKKCFEFFKCLIFLTNEVHPYLSRIVISKSGEISSPLGDVVLNGLHHHCIWIQKVLVKLWLWWSWKIF